MTDGGEAHAAAAMVSLRKIIRYLRIADREIEMASGLSSAQLFVLATLADTPALSLAEVADRALTDQSSVSTVVARLVERGLIARKSSQEDRRRAELHLTAAGHKVLKTAPQVPQKRLVDAILEMPASRRTELVRCLDCLVQAVGADDVKPKLLFQEDESPKKKR